MKYKFRFLIPAFIICVASFFVGCGKKGQEKVELTEAEKKYVGEWVLKDIVLERLVDETWKFRMQYSKKDETFTTSAPTELFEKVCERYWEHTTLCFSDNKESELIDGTLIIKEEVKNFRWKEGETDTVIDFLGMELDFIYGEGNTAYNKKRKIEFMLTPRDEENEIRLAVLDGNYMAYIFERKI